jgi:hypothetical protein
MLDSEVEPTVRAPPMAGDAHPLRVGGARQRARIADAPPVNGPRKRNKAVSFGSMAPAKRSSREIARPAISIGGMKAAAAIGWNQPVAKVDRHHARQRAMVRRSIPGTADRRARRAGVVPCSIAEINVTLAARLRVVSETATALLRELPGGATFRACGT